MQNYLTHYITGFDNLKIILDQLDNDPLVEDYTYEVESRGENDNDHMYFIQIITTNH